MAVIKHSSGFSSTPKPKDLQLQISIESMIGFVLNLSLQGLCE